MTSADGELAEDLRRRIAATLDPLVPPGAEVGLIGGVLHPNAGDHAILLGILAYLRDRRARVTHFVGNAASYSADAVRRRLPAGAPLLIRGGGSMNDVWPGHQDFHELVITDHPERPVVQLPQSIWFRDPARARQAGEVMGAHERLTLMVRDEASRDRAVEMGLDPVMAPDSALYLGHRSRPRDPSEPVLILGRDDAERAIDWNAADGVVPRFDWATGADAALFDARVADRLLRATPGSGLAQRLALGRQTAASKRVLRGAERAVSRGRVVVTDRIHGHILCLLLGIPHVILDNADGKVSAFHRAWTSRSALARTAVDPDEAIALAQKLARETGGA